MLKQTSKTKPHKEAPCIGNAKLLKYNVYEVKMHMPIL